MIFSKKVGEKVRSNMADDEDLELYGWQNDLCYEVDDEDLKQ